MNFQRDQQLSNNQPCISIAFPYSTLAPRFSPPIHEKPPSHRHRCSGCDFAVQRGAVFTLVGVDVVIVSNLRFEAPPIVLQQRALALADVNL